MSVFTFDIPLRVSISVGANAPASFAPTGSVPTLAQGLERVDIDPAYESRAGYDTHFLGAAVPLPVLSEEQRRNAAKNSMVAAGEDPTVLPYHHFSIVMNRRRQLAWYTAVNIDGAQSKKPERSGDRWYFDPRIAESEQIGEELYARNELDRGHLVRRLDPAWGSPAQALRANNDTFHFTNCSPQHAQFNQNSETWQGIENFLLRQAQNEKQRLTIFTGPVLTDEDPLYRGVRLPTHFWKIAVLVGHDESLEASAYLLDQAELVDGLERFDAEVFQVTIEEIIERTALDFSHLSTLQVSLERDRDGLERTTGGLLRRRVSRPSDVLRRE
jgi:endonuclease G